MKSFLNFITKGKITKNNYLNKNNYLKKVQKFGLMDFINAACHHITNHFYHFYIRLFKNAFDFVYFFR